MFSTHPECNFKANTYPMKHVADLGWKGFSTETHRTENRFEMHFAKTDFPHRSFKEPPKYKSKITPHHMPKNGTYCTYIYSYICIYDENYHVHTKQLFTVITHMYNSYDT